MVERRNAMSELSEAYAELPKRPDLLVLPDEVMRAAGVPEDDWASLQDMVIDTIRRQTQLAFGGNWGDEIPPDGIESARIEVLYRALLDQFPMPDNRAKHITRMIREAEVQARTTYQLIRHYVRQNMYRIVTSIATGGAAAAAFEIGTQVYDFFKGEFRHYEEVGPYIKQAQAQGARIRVLKGDDEQGAAVVKDLAKSAIPARLWSHQRHYPKVRLYHLNTTYLLLISLGNQEFAAFQGSSEAGTSSATDYFDICWNEARELDCGT